MVSFGNIGVLLRDVGEATPQQLVRRQAKHRRAGEAHVAVPLRRHVVDALEHRGLSRAVLADHGDDLAGGDVEIDAVDDQPSAAVARACRPLTVKIAALIRDRPR